MVSCLGSLVQSCCGEGGELQTNVTGVCGEYSQCSGHTGIAPAHSVCAFPVYTAQAPGCSTGSGPELGALPTSKLLSFRFSGTPQRRRLSWACILCLPRSSSSGNQELDERTLFRCSATSPLPSHSLSFQARQSGMPCVSSVELISGCDPPGGCQPSSLSGSLWLETGSLFAVW